MAANKIDSIYISANAIHSAVIVRKIDGIDWNEVMGILGISGRRRGIQKLASERYEIYRFEEERNVCFILKTGLQKRRSKN